MFRNRSFLKNSRGTWSVAALGLSALLLVSCGGDDDEDPTPTAEAPTEAVLEEPTEEVVASPAAASPVASPVVASPVASPVVASPVAATPAMIVASPVLDAATPVASPVASPVATGPVEVAETDELGEFLTDSEGMTLYIFTNDEADSGESSCVDGCATNWPPFSTDDMELPEGVEGELTVVTRDDGAEQLAFNGWPLYYFANDEAEGDTNGHEAGDVWFVAAVGDDATPEASPES